jgi:DNA-binding LacI/PurR family transcriptional regulator
VRGYRRAIEEAPAAGQELVLASGPDFSPESGAVLARTLFAQNDPPTALLVASDTLAIGVLRALQEMGLKVPQDVGIVGFGDLEIAPLLDPPLTTVSLPADEMGRQVMAMLRRLRGGARLRPRHSTIGTRLVIRRSCGCREDSV